MGRRCVFWTLCVVLFCLYAELPAADTGAVNLKHAGIPAVDVLDTSLIGAGTGSSAPPASEPGLPAVFCTRAPEVLRNLARVLTIAVQFWRA